MTSTEEMALFLAKTLETKNSIINQLIKQIKEKDIEISEMKKQLEEETEG
ncbi:hypothetical protein [Facklamia miroungae]|uniref:Uncharacterized protein n=1 Tax=Facklamia miroungae TaxID=120956 RepID=A0A1G7P0P2_9LACT|nr:hypothetical protein [Facklamia miroungae]NKZ28541.1 hypothetical protein [Facklamia miroungae]SDF79876.1 hypothetical protein SAMN05421791_10182 [Facklamia miroungae]